MVLKLYFIVIMIHVFLSCRIALIVNKGTGSQRWRSRTIWSFIWQSSGQTVMLISLALCINV